MKQALPVFQIPKSFLVALVLLIHTEKFKGILDFFYIRATKGKFQADIVLHLFVVHITRVLRDEVNSSVHGTSGTNQLAAQGVKGSVTNALAAAFLGSLGGGKSFCNNLIIYYAVLFGGKAVIVDPKSERGNWQETLPDIAQEIKIVNLTSEDKNRGLLDPYVIMKRTKDAESLAIDILTFLTGISSRDGEKFPVLRRAIRSVTQSKKRGLLRVIDELRKDGSSVAGSIADHIESMTDYDFAHLLFSDGDVEQSISLDRQLNIIQVADLVLPDKDTKFEEYTTMELLSVAMLIVISTFALDFIHSDRSIFKMVDLDEAWTFLQVAQGKALSNKARF